MRYSDDHLSLSHALLHLRANKITEPSPYGGGWYSGNRKHFVARHLKAIALLEKMLAKEDV